MPLKSNDGVVKTDTIFPSMSLLFHLPDEAIQVMFRLVSMLVKDSKSGECSVSNKAIEKFKAEHTSNNNNVEVSLIRLASNSHSRHYFMRLGNCSESPSKKWKECVKINDKAIAPPPKTIGRRIKCVKFMVKVMKKHLDKNSINETMMIDSKKMQEKKEELVEDPVSSSDDSE